VDALKPPDAPSPLEIASEARLDMVLAFYQDQRAGKVVEDPMPMYKVVMEERAYQQVRLQSLRECLRELQDDSPSRFSLDEARQLRPQAEERLAETEEALAFLTSLAKDLTARR